MSEKDNLQRTHYADVLVSVSAFENHVVETMKIKRRFRRIEDMNSLSIQRIRAQGKSYSLVINSK